MRRFLLVAGLMLLLGGVLGLALLEPIITQVHAGRGPRVFADLLRGRERHSVSYYHYVGREIFRTPLVAATTLGAVGIIFSVAPRKSYHRLRARGRIEQSAETHGARSGLALTGLTVILALAVFAMTLEWHESSRTKFAPPHSSLSAGPIDIGLSHPTGFYDGPIEVEVAASGVERLYFTLDGSQPDPENNRDATRRVEGPILVDDRSEDPNIYANIPTTVKESRRFAPPDFPVPKATVLRVRGEGTTEVFATYYVGESVRPQTLPTLSLIAEPAYLFDHKIGILIPGATTDAWRRSDRYERSANPDRIEANYQMRGRDWERPLRETQENPVVIQLCESDGDCSFMQSVGVRTHGGWSRSFSPDKSLRLYSRDVYGKASFDYEFFGSGAPSHTRLVLRNSGNDWNRLRFMDAFWHSLFPDDHVDTQAYMPLRLFLNGEYWGIYNLRERQDEHYIENVHGVERDRVEMLDNSTAVSMTQMRANPPESGAPRANPFAPEVYESWAEFINTIDLEAPDAAAIRAEVDIASFHDFVIAHTFAGVSDWVSNNSRWWRVRGSPQSDDESLADGRWRFMIADFDSATTDPWGDSPFTRREARRITDVRDDRPLRRDGLPHLFVATMNHPELRNEFLARYADLINTALHPARTTRELDSLVALLGPEMELSRRRWLMSDMEYWHDSVNRLRIVLEERPDVMRDELIKFLELEGSADVKIVFGHGLESLRINTVDLLEIAPDGTIEDIDPRRMSWSGNYFLGVPIALKAEVADGHRFVGWTGLPADAILSSDSSVTFLLQQDMIVEALVEKAP